MSGPPTYFNPDVKRVLDVELVRTLDHDSVVCCVRFSPDGKYVATGSNRLAQIFDAHDGRKVCRFEIQHGDDAPNKAADLYVRALTFSPDGRYLLTGTEDKLLRIRSSVSPSRQTVSMLLLVAWTTTYVYVWDIHSGALIEELGGSFGGHGDAVFSLAFSPDGKNLISGSLDRTVKMWEVSPPQDGESAALKGGKFVKMFVGHRDFVLAVAYTPDAEWILSSSKDLCVQFWDPNTGKFQFELQGHRNSVISVAVSPKGGYFVTGSGDMKARIWSYQSF
ncbi:hypothetical protein E4U15_005899 [Claviceps sp. LM218 group G6]|nr:hypothetical protein E4U15_005899 [Claviceps sp. LM218 group G6]